MNYRENLRNILTRIDGSGYKAYKDIKGQYDFGNYVLYIDHVQGDPFAAPTKARVSVNQQTAGFPEKLFNTRYKRIALTDFITRVFKKNIDKHYNRVCGTGKSGLLIIDNCGQQILDRTSVIIDTDKIEARFEVGLPATGRKVLGKSAASILMNTLPKIVEASLMYKNINARALEQQVRLSEDQYFLREEIERLKLVAFIVNGSILPRQSGISQRPLAEGAVPFKSPESMEVEINLPNKGSIKGMGIKEGISLIVGGGYHGKSTLLDALEMGIYNHIEGDGREYVATRENAVKIRAEDGRSVNKVNISPFINNLPNGQDTKVFSTENASGSTSQAANIVEALEVGTDLLLIDEDTSATNFMIRDKRMQKLVAKEKEPITPFIDRVKQLYEDLSVSTVIVVGGSGDYFDVADTVIMMDEYIPRDVTQKAFEIAKEFNYGRNTVDSHQFLISSRILLSSGFHKGPRGLKIKSRGLHTILYDKNTIDLSNVEQLVDTSQTNCLSVMLEYAINNLIDNSTTLTDCIDKLYSVIESKGLDGISPYTGHPGNLAFLRKYEFAAMINRYRKLKTN